MNQLFRLLALSLLVIFVTGFNATAQKDEDENPLLEEDGVSTYSEGFNIRERIFIGGNTGFGFTNNQSNFNLSPFAGVRVTDHFQVGTGMNYSLTTFKTGTYTEKYHLIGFKAFTRYLLINFDALGSGMKREAGEPLGGVYAHFEYENNIVKAKTNTGSSAQFDTPQSLFIGAGYQENFYRGFGIFFEFVYDLLYDETQPYSSPWPFDIRGGFYYGF